MKHIKKILYIHGINSSGHTGKTLQRIFKEKYIFPIVESIDANYEKVNEYVKNHDSAPLADLPEEDF